MAFIALKHEVMSLRAEVSKCHISRGAGTIATTLATMLLSYANAIATERVNRRCHFLT